MLMAVSIVVCALECAGGRSRSLILLSMMAVGLGVLVVLHSRDQLSEQLDSCTHD